MHIRHGTSRIARGGHSIDRAPVGILMLDARFLHVAGDMGNGTTWPFPVLLYSGPIA